jgi:hypothetical protein
MIGLLVLRTALLLVSDEPTAKEHKVVPAAAATTIPHGVIERAFDIRRKLTVVTPPSDGEPQPALVLNVCNFEAPPHAVPLIAMAHPPRSVRDR